MQKKKENKSFRFCTPKIMGRILLNTQKNTRGVQKNASRAKKLGCTNYWTGPMELS